MKIHTIISIGFVLFFSACAGSKNEPGTNADGTLSGKLTFSGAFAMYPMVVKWGEEFKKLHPEVQFDIQAGGAGKGMTDVLSGTVDFGMVSREINTEEINKGAHAIGVAIDAVIPTFSASNPYLDEIYKQGVSREDFNEIYLTEKVKTWGDLLGNSSKENIEVYTRSDACGAGETFAKYIGNVKQEDLNGIGIFGDPGLAEAVIKDKYAIGYNNVNFTYDVTSRKPNKGIAVLPLDLNSNDTLDAGENVYGSLDQLNKAILDGVFPSPPSRLLYLVHKGVPDNDVKKAFLNWILTDGQKLCPETGYIALDETKTKEQLNRITQSN